MVGHKWDRAKTTRRPHARHTVVAAMQNLVLATSIPADAGSRGAYSEGRYRVRIKPLALLMSDEISISGVEYSALHNHKLLRFARSGGQGTWYDGTVRSISGRLVLSPEDPCLLSRSQLDARSWQYQ